jgi:hypothetical protein
MIEELKALAEKATPGPWQHHMSHVYGPDPMRELVCQFRNGPWLTSDRDLIAALRNNLPAIISALEAVPVMKEALEDIGIYGCGMLNQPIELNQPPEQWMQKRIERMEQVARQALAALEKV